MQVSRSSWHMRLCRRMSGDDPYVARDLCHHFRGVMWRLGVIVLGVVLAIACVVTMGWWLYMAVTIMIKYPIIGLILGIIAVCAVLLIVGLRKLISWYQEHSANAVPKPPKPPKQPNLLVSYIKAKKRKICPLIDEVD